MTNNKKRSNNKKFKYLLIFIFIISLILYIYLNSFISKKLNNGFSILNYKIKTSQNFILVPFKFDLYGVKIENSDVNFSLDTLKLSSFVPFIINTKLYVNSGDINLTIKQEKSNKIDKNGENRSVDIYSYKKYLIFAKMLSIKSIDIRDVNIKILNDEKQLYVKNMIINLENLSYKKIKNSSANISVEYDSLNFKNMKGLSFNNGYKSKINIYMQDDKMMFDFDNKFIQNNLVIKDEPINVDTLYLNINSVINKDSLIVNINNRIDTLRIDNYIYNFNNNSIQTLLQYNFEKSITKARVLFNRRKFFNINYRTDNKRFFANFNKNIWLFDSSLVEVINTFDGIKVKNLDLKFENTYISGKIDSLIYIDSLFLKLNGDCNINAIKKYQLYGFNFMIKSQNRIIINSSNILGNVELNGGLKAKYLPLNINADTTHFETILFFEQGYIPNVYSKVHAITNRGVIGGQMNLEFNKKRFTNLKDFLEGHKSRIKLKYRLFNLKSLFGINVKTIDGYVDIKDSNLCFNYKINNQFSNLKYSILPENETVDVVGKFNINKFNTIFTQIELAKIKNITKLKSLAMYDSIYIEKLNLNKFNVAGNLEHKFKKKLQKIS